jgi:hypothetical protein
MLEIEAASIVDGNIVGDDLILTRQNATTINAGSVRGAQGIAGPAGSDLAVLATQGILDIGMVGQIRAGRQLTATDFTGMGLAAPIGLWNLSTVADSSGNGRSLVNKGAVPFDVGINGLATTAARFSGSTAQGLYIADVGAADPFRVRGLSVGCWFRSAKRDADQGMVAKYATTTNLAFWLQTSSTTRQAQFGVSNTGTFAASKSVLSLTEVCDDRWHFIVATYDGSLLRMYVDGVYESALPGVGPIFASTAPFTIGGLALDAATIATNPSFGSIDEAFITGDVLSEDQIRKLYCAKITHALGSVPKRVSINVRPFRKGAALISGDFPTAPLRLHNFSAGALTSEGSQAISLVNNGAAVTVPGVEGSLNNAFHFNAAPQSLSAADTTLPSGTGSWSFGQWVKTIVINANMAVSYYGGAPYSVLHWIASGGAIVSRNVNAPDDIGGPFIADGEWHFLVTTATNTPTDGVKRKFYVDGRLVGGSTVLNSITLGGANAFRVGSGNLGTDLPLNGSVDSVFICGYVLTAEQIVALYIKGSQTFGNSPKNSGDHVEQMTGSYLLCLFDTLEMQNQIDLAVG